MNPDPTDREPNAGFGDGWEPDPEALRVATHYLVHMPDQGDWPWEDHCEGLAGGILHALHESGYQIVPKVELDQVVPTPSWRQLMAQNDQLRRELAAMKVELVENERFRHLLPMVGFKVIDGDFVLKDGSRTSISIKPVDARKLLSLALQALDKENE